MIFAFVVMQFYTAVEKMVQLDDNSYSSYFIPKSRSRDDPLLVADYGGQMYIALK